MQDRPFYFMVTFWGARYRDYFYSLCVPSLLAPNNVPILKDRPGCKILIATTSEDWASLQSRPLIKRLAEYIELFPIFIGEPGNTPTALHAAKGHRLACRKANEDRAFAGWLTPDLIVSDGMIGRAVRLVDQGKKLVLCPALRFEMEHPIDVLTASGHLRAGEPVDISAQSLSAIAVNSLHPELLRYEFTSEDFADYPIWTFWRVPDRNGLILYTVSWSFLFADFTASPSYQDECFTYSTNDGVFAHLNFGHLRNTEHAAYIKDSYDGVFLSLTSRDDINLKYDAVRRSNRLRRMLGFDTIERLAAISRFHHGSDIDPLRRSLHTIPVVIHSDQIDSSYRECLARSSALMRAAIEFKGATDYRQLYDRFTSDSDLKGWYRLPHPALFRTVVFALNLYAPLNYYVMVAGQVLTGKTSVTHILRRVLHVLTFGVISYPRSTNTDRFVAPLLPGILKLTGEGESDALAAREHADSGS